ncbi:hypothetical protein ACHAWT_001258 [Skeletonema menzelii]
MASSSSSSSTQEEEQQRTTITTEYRILALYRFTPLVTANHHPSWDEQSLMKHPERHPQLLQLQSELYATLRRYETRGTLLIAPEGINGTICYPYPPPTLSHHDNNNDNDTAEEIQKYDNEDDPVKSFISNHPLFGGDGLRTRSSVWKEHDDEHNNNNPTTTTSNSNSRPQQAFQRLKIKIKPEIVTLGLGRPTINNKNHQTQQHTLTKTPSIQNRHLQNQLANPNITKGTYLNPQQWDDAMRDPNVLVIDTRNSYEIDIGTFESAVDPQTRHFSEFPEYLERLAGEYDWDEKMMMKHHHQQQEKMNGDDDDVRNNDGATSSNNQPTVKKKQPPTAIALFCTGGIRCEKATSYALQSNLFPKNLPIYHLEGGILSYLDDVAKRKSNKEGEGGEEGRGGSSSSSTFHGECFVFDKRVALTEGLEPTNKYVSCHGCRGPMDRRLLDKEVDSGGVDDDSNDDAAINANVELQKKKKEYEQLLMGIRNLPPLTYDSATQRWYVPGLTCPRCHDGTTRESFERFAQRKEQMEICAREGKSHFQDNGRKL